MTDPKPITDPKRTRTHGGQFLSLADTGVVIFVTNVEDAAARPAGGGAVSVGWHIQWQDGPVNRDAGEKPNGAFVEDVLEACRRRLEFYEGGPFACPENAAAIDKVTEAIEALVERRRDRKARGVQGRHKA